MDLVLFVALVAAFAVWVTAHVATVCGLVTRSPRWRGLVALIVVPIAPYWAFRERMRVRFGLWVFGAIAYGVLAFFGAR